MLDMLYRAMTRRIWPDLVASAIIAALPMIVAASLPNHGVVTPKSPLTVRDIIESARFLNWCRKEGEVCLSPDGSRYLAVVARGDVRRNGVWVEFFTGEMQSLNAAIPRIAARLFTPALGNTPVTTMNGLSWSDDGETVAFLWEDVSGVKQVFSLNLLSHRLRQLTHHPTNIERFSISADWRDVAYIAIARRDLAIVARMRETGYAVSRGDGYSYFDGDIDGWRRRDQLELFIANLKKHTLIKVQVDSVRGAGWPAVLEFVDGGKIIANLPRDDVPSEWSRYSDSWMKRIGLPTARRDPEQSLISQLYLIDQETGRSKPLMDAPFTPGRSARIVSAPDGESVLVGPTFLPAGRADAAGLSGNAIAEVDLTTGNIDVLPLPSSGESTIFVPKTWCGDAVEVQSRLEYGGNLWFEKKGRKWHLLSRTVNVLPEDKIRRVQIELHQDLNTPPMLFAVDDSGASRLLLDPSQDIRSKFSLGAVRSIEWRALDDLSWSGVLYYPVNHMRGRRYPLVIQTHGYSNVEFSLTGNNDHPTIFAAQALANEGIVVLQIGGPSPGQVDGPWQATPREGAIMMSGIDGAISALVSRGLVDAKRVGLSGFSRTGWVVEYALTHSKFLYAAAIAADNVDQGYLQSAFTGWPMEPNRGNGDIPFGEGLASWMMEAPGFNADRVRTPLRLQVNSGSAAFALSHWEMFTRLRYLGLPVELYVIPRMREGTHNLQNPGQLLASAGGAVDWFDFWLNGHEDPSSEKSEQYARWRILRKKQDGALKRPRRPLLRWNSMPLMENYSLRSSSNPN